MKKATTLIAALAVFLTVFTGAAIADDETDRNRSGSETEAPSLYDIARDASKGRWIVDRNGGDFDILLLALKVTGLDKVIDDPTQDLTVFAPTDDTFRATFGGRTELRVLFNVLRAVNYDKDALANVLLYHVTALNTDDEKGLSSDEVLANVPIDVPMVNGDTAFASFDGTSLTLEGGSSAPSVVDLGAIDIGRGTASNGIIHVIGESVLLP